MIFKYIFPKKNPSNLENESILYLTLLIPTDPNFPGSTKKISALMFVGEEVFSLLSAKIGKALMLQDFGFGFVFFRKN